MAGAVDSIGNEVGALPDMAAGAARAVAFFLFSFVLEAAGGTMGGRAGGMMMISILLLEDLAM